ncbi:DNA polymerase [Sulfobacillus harzensis]|uniref:DNA polymerase n=1 Tax=Sulfobacillus harzensis TaxID=2729629 RepID=A0A7Y0L5K2_9FIRM|nr:DNA polymerase [Sulfobacillus harzensis]NMP23377.1 DNA polymerase [Sulfobacillus harzensis]
MRSSSHLSDQMLMSAVDAGQLAQALIISGSQAAQDRVLAQLVPRLLCEAGGQSGCCCRSCQTPWSSHPDVFEVVPQGATIRREEAQAGIAGLKSGPLWSPAKVVIIRPADSLGREAESYLLKHLEEPPSYAIYLLVTEHPDRLMATIRSRCQWWRVGDDGARTDVSAVVETLWSEPLTGDRVIAATYWVRDRYRHTGQSQWLAVWEALAAIHRQLEANGNAELAAAQLRRLWPSEEAR